MLGGDEDFIASHSDARAGGVADDSLNFDVTDLAVASSIEVVPAPFGVNVVDGPSILLEVLLNVPHRDPLGALLCLGLGGAGGQYSDSSDQLRFGELDLDELLELVEAGGGLDLEVTS